MIHIPMRIAAVLVAGILTTQPTATQRQREADMVQVDKAIQHVQEFRQKHLLGSLREAVAGLEAVDIGKASRGVSAHEVASTSKQSGDRQKVTRAWTTVLHELEQSIDPKFDPSDVPEVNIVPPPTSDGVRYPSGVDPKAIPDPVARAEYEKMLHDNEAKTKRYNYQHGLHVVDEQSTAGFLNFLNRFYTRSNADQAELERLLTEGHLSASRRAHVLDAVRAPS